jgi:organic hydroperoxide reductase OsmC/OhrA
MHPFPHIYPVTASARSDSNVTLSTPGVESIDSAAPAEFGGPGDRWSPESLLVAAVADCFILSFKAIARASRFDWSALECHVDGTLERIEGSTRFTGFSLNVTLTIAADANPDKAERLLVKAEHSCLITNSLTADTQLATEVVVSNN